MRQQRVIIENISPQLHCGAFFVKRIVGDTVTVYADIFADGHDLLEAELRYSHEGEEGFRAVRMSHLGNDVYSAEFTVTKIGRYHYWIAAWIDHPLNWQHGIKAKLNDGQYVKSELLDGVQYLKNAQKAVTTKKDAGYLSQCAAWFRDDKKYDAAVEAAVSDRLRDLFVKYPSRKLATVTDPLQVYTDRQKASFSTWYEFFPRSTAPNPGEHGTFKDAEKILPKIAAMGFDVVYLPPIHPIGEVNRKGKNNTVTAEEGDSGVPWAIGSKHGGHKSIHPELGNEADLKRLIKTASKLGMEIALDLAFQAAPDHPYIKEHPEWFRRRPDGTMQYAENPPKKYQDIVNFNFECKEYQTLWNELLQVTLHWIGMGISVFRVDNPHTKPYYFWNWLIDQVKSKHPEVLFLSEAFSRPKVMQQLAKQGFSQSYTYFTWRVHKQEIITYMEELTGTDMREYFRPNFWPNTPDINPYHLQGANEAMHSIRYVLAATLSGNIGIYGPVFEYGVTDPVAGKEEYLHSEKYEIKHWDWTVENKLTRLITKVNTIRNEHPALQQTNNLEFCELENDQLIGFYKWDNARENHILVVISLDPHHTQKGMVRIPVSHFTFSLENGLAAHDTVTDSTYHWEQEWNYIELHPDLPFHIFHLKPGE